MSSVGIAPEVINGALGEGGGQVFRTALTIAMCQGKPVRIKNIRAGRKKTGLLRQHLACLRAAQQICAAEVTGAELGSSTVTFVPGPVQSGEYRFAIGSAGSTTLLFQTVLMPLLLADEVSELYFEGGTHNGMAPSFDFIEQCFLPVAKKMGCRVDVSLERYGFYPAGGGAWRAKIYPLQRESNPTGSMSSLSMLDDGEIRCQSAMATSARIPKHVTERELEQIHRKCYWPRASLHQNLVNSVGPGNIVSLRVERDQLTEVFETVGELNVSAERVAGRAIRKMKRYLKARVTVGEYLADQLVLPMALGKGGCFSTLLPSQHLRTNIDVIKQLLDIDIQLIQINEDHWQVLVQ
ncbi:RNA 3'-terminal phosphate cyclase [Motiliproteus sp. MSK22-1]|uniref:RNA 3'-terminal phosphate cyclase n=1 Tax=Motiliproteus sp. MSK22-1 TaxID=1897630 RepID=UPI00097805AE|nr:RNA 3'-terminal phosphate cyclase [Motiliproteus sp. MSK22-1]OMH32769.1 RNA 3'-terminal-phosphate cyclase [Motiliproteus sp. MSK22-1]